jgi:uncharacterized protein
MTTAIAKMQSALVAYSGGVDSAVVLAVARRALSDRAVGCIGESPSLPARELQDALELARLNGFIIRIIHPDEHLDPNYAANPSNRCYFCKSALFERLHQIAETEGWGAVLDGTHADDLGDDRPGRIAAQERGVRSPLAEAGCTKADVRAIAQHLGLSVWDKPAMACLASRVPHGTPVTAALLKQIERAEDVLAGLGFRQFRARHHGDLVRIELPAEDIPRAIELRDTIVRGIRAAGYKQVTLDLAGFRAEPSLPLVNIRTRRLTDNVPQPTSVQA